MTFLTLSHCFLSDSIKTPKNPVASGAEVERGASRAPERNATTGKAVRAKGLTSAAQQREHAASTVAFAEGKQGPQQRDERAVT